MRFTAIYACMLGISTAPTKQSDAKLSIDDTFVQREKRFEVNELVGFDAIVSRAGDDQSLYYANLIDFSRTGGKFELPFCARFDELLKIKFDLKESDLKYSGDCRVRHMRNVGENRWHVGCSLDPPIPEDVIAHLAKRTNQERRRHPRFDIFGEGKLRRQGTQETCEAVIRNISRGGFCLMVPNEHPVGENVDFVVAENDASDTELESGSQAPEKLNIGARIRWQSHTSDGFMLGCSFVDAASYSKLVDCLTDNEDQKIDKTSWLVVTAAVASLLFPIISSFLASHKKPNQPNINKPVVQVESKFEQDANADVVKSKPQNNDTIDDNGSEPLVSPDAVETVTTDVKASLSNDELAMVEKTESPVPSEKQLVDNRANQPEQSTKKETIDTKSVTRPEFESEPETVPEFTKDGIPTVLTKQPQIVEKSSTDAKDKGSSRRVKTRRPIVIESEEIILN